MVNANIVLHTMSNVWISDYWYSYNTGTEFTGTSLVSHTLKH